MPIPGGLNNLAQVLVLGIPTQFSFNLLRAGHQDSGIAWPAVNGCDVDSLSSHFGSRVNNLPDGVADAVAQVICAASRRALTMWVPI